jgi:hypothetical protein
MFDWHFVDEILADCFFDRQEHPQFEAILKKYDIDVAQLAKEEQGQPQTLATTMIGNLFWSVYDHANA